MSFNSQLPAKPSSADVLRVTPQNMSFAPNPANAPFASNSSNVSIARLTSTCDNVPAGNTRSAFTTVWDLDYFSGSQISIYIGDVWVDEVTSLQYETRQNKVPLYGYASQQFNQVAAGQLIVQGSFTINFKEQGYMWAILNRYFNSLLLYGPVGDKADETALQARVDKSPMTQKGNTLSGGGGKAAANKVSMATIERMVQGEATTAERYDNYLSLAGNTTFNVNNPKDKVFENLMESFEDQVWGSQNSTLEDQIRRTDRQEYDGFDMYVLFGNYQNAQANHTVQKIVGVSLLSQGKMIQIDGRPVQEQYDFIAKTVV